LNRHPEVPAHPISDLSEIGHFARASKDDRPGPSPFEALASLGHLRVTDISHCVPLLGQAR